MRRNLIFTGQWLVTALILAIGLNFYSCSDTASVSENVAAPLSSLTVTPGTFQPAFFANTTNYAVNAPTSATSVTVAAVPKDITATVTIDGIIATQRSVPLGGPGSTKTILILVETQAGLATTYTVNVTRLLSSDNNLSALSVKVGTVAQTLSPTFASATLDYMVNVQTNVTTVAVTATKSDSDASMQIHSVTVPGGTASGQASITLGNPGTATPVSIEVTAPNGSKRTYRITIKRLAGDSNLSALNVTPGAMSPPVFEANTLNYTVNVLTDVTNVTVSATKSDLNAVMQIHSVTVPAGTASGQDTIPLNGPGADTSILITVTAQNGVDSKTYTIKVHRAAPSSDNNLSALTVTEGPLVPDFAPSTTTYTVEVSFSISRVTVTATKSDLNAVMSGDVDAGSGVQTGQRNFNLPQVFGFTRTISITVTAPNGNAKIYTIELKRPTFFP